MSKIQKEASGFDAFANSLAIVFLLEMDDWIYPALEAGCPQLCDELFEIEYNRKIFAPGVTEKDVKSIYGNTSG